MPFALVALSDGLLMYFSFLFGFTEAGHLLDGRVLFNVGLLLGVESTDVVCHELVG